jgi:hypothetical protein
MRKRGILGIHLVFCKLRIIKLQGGRGRSFYLGKVEEGIEGSPLNFLVHKNVMGKVPIVGRNNQNFTHNVLMHKKI